MAIFRKGGQRKMVEDHLTERINVLLGQGWVIEAAQVIEADQQPPVTVLPDDFPGRAHLLAAGLTGAALRAPAPSTPRQRRVCHQHRAAAPA